MSPTYSIFCNKCTAKTPHRVYLAMRRKGVKLKCLICGTPTRYINLSKLQQENLT